MNAKNKIIIFVTGFLILLIAITLTYRKTRVKSAVVSAEIILENGGRVSWLRQTNIVAFDRMEEDGYFDIYKIDIETGEVTPITKNMNISKYNVGNPDWHPSGEYLTVQVQSTEVNLPGAPEELKRYLASPGVGVNNNLWIIKADGSEAWQITDLQEGMALLHPHFSPKGDMIVWTQTTEKKYDRVGHWEMVIADFSIENGEPVISNIREIKPLNLQVYEAHGFSPDGEKIIFSGIKEGGFFYDMEIYLYDINTGETTQLTDNDEWDEHAHYTPDGKYIIWVSSKDIPQKKAENMQQLILHPLTNLIAYLAKIKETPY